MFESTLARPWKHKECRGILWKHLSDCISYTRDLPVAFKVTLKKSCSVGYHRVPMCLELGCFSNFMSTTFPLFCGLFIGPHHDQWCSELLLISLLDCFSPTRIHIRWYQPLLSSSSKYHHSVPSWPAHLTLSITALPDIIHYCLLYS